MICTCAVNVLTSIPAFHLPMSTVYVIKLKDIKREELYDKYIMEIENIIKTGKSHFYILSYEFTDCN